MGSRLEKNSKDVSKRIQSHTFSNEEGEEYRGSKYGGFTDYMRRKKIKLQNLDAELRSQSADNPNIFRGIVVHVNGYTQPSLGDLHTLIVTHGGGFLQYLDGKTACTHIVASQLTLKKKADFAKYRIVKPAWVVDSVKAGKLLPWDNYRLVDEGESQKVLGFDNGNIVSQANRQPQSYRGQTDTSWYTSQIKNWSARPEGEIYLLQGGVSQLFEDHPESYSPAPAPLPQAREEGEFADAFDDEDASLILPAFNPHGMNQAQSKPETELDDAAVEFADFKRDHEQTIEEKTSTSGTDALQTAEKRKLTAEEHNAILLQNPHLAKSSTANPDFLNQYYRESRLHHLSTWKADLKAQLQARTIEKSASQKTKPKRPPGVRRYIMHVDFDSFFAAVSLRKNPHLIDEPVVIAHGSGPSSEIASCNYPARKFGIKNGMWMKTALEMCPDIKVLPYDFKAYEEASRHFYDSILAIDGVVQSISIDEALIDISELCIKAGGSDGKEVFEGAIYQEQEKASELARSLRESVKTKTGCDVSVGIGGNILLAKVALRKAKPAGQHLIKPEDMLDFIGELTVTDLPGVAYSLGNKLQELGVKYVKDIRSLTKERLTNALGPKTGEKLWDYAQGIDKVEVGNQVVRKSVSAEINWGIRFTTQQQAEQFVQCLCDELHRRLLENGVKGRQLTVKIMRKAADAGLDPPKSLGHGKCDTFNKSIVLGVATNDKEILGKDAISILRGYGFSPGELRGLGVQMQKLEPIKPIPAAAVTPIDSSQRRLQFKIPEKQTESSRDLLRTQQLPAPNAVKSPRQTDIIEPIEDVRTYEKSRTFQAVQTGIDQIGMENEKPLNIIGTQFMMPTQIDPTVLAELPADIRAKLAPKQKSILDKITRAESSGPDPFSRSSSPYLSDTEYGLPTQSQIDPETLAALPGDMREEVLAHYRSLEKPGPSGRNQQLVPQSPRKAQPTISSEKVQLTPTKKQKNSSVFNRGRSKIKGGSSSNLTQSNFVGVPAAKGEASNSTAPPDLEVPKSFLDELPEDIRLEILTEQKRNRMQLKSGLNFGNSRRKPRTDRGESEVSKGQRKLSLTKHSKRPTFTSSKLNSLPELRDAVSAWVQEFSDMGEEGPFEEDATSLGQYLQKVVLEEGDMYKAASVVDWLAYLVSDWPFEHDVVRLAWLRIITLLQRMVQESVKERGLPPLVFVTTKN